MIAKLHISIKETRIRNKLQLLNKAWNVQILRPEQNENEFISYLSFKDVHPVQVNVPPKSFLPELETNIYFF